MPATVNLKLLLQAVDKASGVVNSLNAQLNAVSEAADKLATKSKKSGDSGKKGMQDFADGASRAKTSVEKLLEATDKFADIGTQIGAIAAAIPAALAVKSSADFERAMSGVVAVTTGAKENFSELKNVAGELGRTTKFTAEQAAEGMQYLGQAGFDAQQVMTGIAPTLQLAVAAAVELGQAANIASNVLSGMRLPIEELTRVTDILAKTAAESNAELIDMAEALSYAGPVAASLGVSIEDLASLVGVLGNAGIQGSRAGTALRGTLAALANPSKKASDTLAELGVNITTSADGSIDLIDVFHQLADANLTAADAYKIFGRYASAGVLAITSQVGALDDMVDANNAAAGAAAEMADIMATNLRGAITKLLSALDGLKRAFGDPLLEPLTLLTKILTSIITTITNLAEEFPILSGTVAILTTTVIGLTTAFVAVTGAVNAFAKAKALLNLSDMAATFKTMATSIIPSVTKQIGALSIAFTINKAAATVTGASFAGLRAAAVTLGQGIGLAAKSVAAFAASTLGVVAGIGILIAGLVAYGRRVSNAIKKNRQLFASMNAVEGTLGKQITSLESINEESDKFSATTKSLRTELLRTAEGNKELSTSAREAAESIDEETGALLDGGEALRLFNKRVEKIKFDALESQIAAIALQFKNFTGEANIADKIFIGLGDLGKVLKAAVDPTETLAGAMKELGERAEKTRDQLVDVGKSYIDELKKIGEFDPTVGVGGLYIYLTKIRGVAPEVADAVTYAFAQMEEAANKAGQKIFEITNFDSKGLEQRVKTGASTIAFLRDTWNEARQEVAKYNQDVAVSGTEREKRNFAAAVKLQIEANKALKAAQEEYENDIRKLKAKRLDDLKKQNEEELSLLETAKDREEIVESQYEVKKTEIAVKYAKDRTSAIEEIAQDIEQFGNQELKVYGEINKQKEAFLRAEVRASKEAETAKIVERKRVQKELVAIEEETQNILSSLSGDTPESLRKKSEAKLAALREEYARKVIEEKELAGLIEAINKETQYKIAAYEEEVRKAKGNAEVEEAQRIAEKKVEVINRQFAKGAISADTYITQSTAAQRAAIDAEIEELKARLDYLKKSMAAEPLIIEVQAEIKGLEAEKEDVGFDEAERTEIYAQEANKRIEIENTLLQAKKDGLSSHLKDLEESGGVEYQLLSNKLEAERLAYAKLTDDKGKLKELETLHMKQLNKQQEENERALAEARIQLASTAAGQLENIFGQLYEATGEEIKAFFYLEKAAAIAQVIINTEQAIMQAYASLPPYVAPVFAALAAVQGGISAGIIGGQMIRGYSTGGEVEGSSPTKKSDNILTRLTAKEWVMPVDAVNKYGKNFMAGLQNLMIPKEVSQGFMLPVYHPPVARRSGYATGGEVEDPTMNEISDQENITEVNITNMVDPSVFANYLNSREGSDAILNIIGDRPLEVKQRLA